MLERLRADKESPKRLRPVVQEAVRGLPLTINPNAAYRRVESNEKPARERRRGIVRRGYDDCGNYRE